MKHQTLIIKFSSLVLFLFLQINVFGQDTFKIVFLGDLNGTITNSYWLNQVASEWKATGIDIRVNWNDLDTDNTPGVDSWTKLDNAINSILNYTPKELDIYIRVSMGVRKPLWAYDAGLYLDDNDFQIMYNGNKYPYNTTSEPERRYPLNFSSPTSQSYMSQFFTAVLDHINNNFSSHKNRFVEVVPSWSITEECEYPGSEMCGYSSYEILAFRSYLENKYINIAELDTSWDASFSSWSSINPRYYHWEDTNNTNDLYPNGRTDWMTFRTTKLKEFVDTLASIAHTKGFECGIQLGCIYDSAIEKRGWYDPTSLIENVDAVHVADRGFYIENFDFGADYLRSICEFWTEKKNRQSNPIKFNIETNWPNNNSLWQTADSPYWDEALETYYNKGAHEHHIINWFSTSSYDWNNYKTTYSDFYNAILSHVAQPLVNVNNNYAVHLGSEQVLFHHNPKLSSGKYELCNSVYAQTPYLSNVSTNYDGNKDIITNYMIQESPTYLNNYTALYFTKGSEHISDAAYKNLMKSSVTKPLVNATHFSDLGHSEYAHTQGIKDEYNDLRSPIHLIWRSRNDLKSIWPDANLPAPGSGHTEDFVTWVYNYGCGYSNQPTNREYPSWEIRDGGSSGLYKYDKNIRSAWNSRNDLKNAFPNAHNNNPKVTSLPNMISWAKNYGYYESSNLTNYNNWPYIGDTGINKISDENYLKHQNELPQKFHISNYPNPFNPTTRINYTIVENSHVKVEVYNILGQKVVNLVNKQMEAGSYSIQFDGSHLASGLYIVTLQANHRLVSSKMLLAK